MKKQHQIKLKQSKVNLSLTSKKLQSLLYVKKHTLPFVLWLSLLYSFNETPKPKECEGNGLEVTAEPSQRQQLTQRPWKKASYRLLPRA